MKIGEFVERFGEPYSKWLGIDIASRRNEEFVVGERQYSLEFNPNIKLRFWDYYRNPYNLEVNRWNTGLFRYLSDSTVLNILKSLRDEYARTKDEKTIKIIDFHILRYEK